MKKTLTSALLALLLLFTACSSSSKEETEPTTPSDDAVSQEASPIGGETKKESPKYNSMLIDYPVYTTPKELIEASDIIMLGKVEAVSFKILDIKTGLPPTDKTEEKDMELCTVYSVKNLTSYKGDVSESVNIRVQGGLKNEKYLKPQLEALGERASEGITVNEGMSELETGATYLFSLTVFAETDPCLSNSTQSAFRIGDSEETSSKDIFGYISPTDIISCFDEEINITPS